MEKRNVIIRHIDENTGEMKYLKYDTVNSVKLVDWYGSAFADNGTSTKMTFANYFKYFAKTDKFDVAKDFYNYLKDNYVENSTTHIKWGYTLEEREESALEDREFTLECDVDYLGSFEESLIYNVLADNNTDKLAIDDRFTIPAFVRENVLSIDGNTVLPLVFEYTLVDMIFEDELGERRTAFFEPVLLKCNNPFKDYTSEVFNYLYVNKFYSPYTGNDIDLRMLQKADGSVFVFPEEQIFTPSEVLFITSLEAAKEFSKFEQAFGVPIAGEFSPITVLNSNFDEKFCKYVVYKKLYGKLGFCHRAQLSYFEVQNKDDIGADRVLVCFNVVGDNEEFEKLLEKMKNTNRVYVDDKMDFGNSNINKYSVTVTMPIEKAKEFGLEV